MIKEKELLSLDLFKEKKTKNLIKAIENSKKRDLSRFIFGMGILNVGEKAAYTLAQRFGTMDNLIKAKRDDLEAIHEIGKVMADSIVKFFRIEQNRKLINKFKKVNINFKEPVKAKGRKLSNKRFVFTGELLKFTRSQASSLVKGAGGDVVSSVSKNTDYVIAFIKFLVFFSLKRSRLNNSFSFII